MKEMSLIACAALSKPFFLTPTFFTSLEEGKYAITLLTESVTNWPNMGKSSRKTALIVIMPKVLTVK